MAFGSIEKLAFERGSGLGKFSLPVFRDGSGYFRLPSIVKQKPNRFLQSQRGPFATAAAPTDKQALSLFFPAS